MRSISVAERRARLGRRHHLARDDRTDDVARIAGDLAGLHATDPVTVYLGALARMVHPAIDAVERELYDHRTVLRMLGMRRTMFALPIEQVPVVHAACAVGLFPVQRRQLHRMLVDGGVTSDPDGWYRSVAEAAMVALRRRGSAATKELAADVDALRERIVVGAGQRFEAEITVSGRVLFLMGVEGRIVRGRPLGSWISGQHRWHPVDDWLPGGIPEIVVADAQEELVRRWLTGFGPALRTDVKWWTKWTLREVDRALHAVGAVEVDLDGSVGYALPDDLDPVTEPDPWVALLPGLDSTPMGWQQRDWYLGPHREPLFDRNGNIGPTIWCDGRIVGGWAQRRDGEIALRLLEDVGAEAAAAIESEAHQLGGLVGETRFTPRFRTPLERDLAAQ